jgi:hypothetical protein
MSLPLADLLRLSDKASYRKVGKLVQDRVRSEDQALLIANVRWDHPFIAMVALAGLTKLAAPSTFPWLVEFWATSGKVPHMLCRNVHQLAEALPPELTLPLAREWFHSSVRNRRWLAERILGSHAAEADITTVRAAMLECLKYDDERCYYLCDILKALCQRGEVGAIPELDLVFEEFRYSYGRKRCAEAMRTTNPTRFAERFAFECLWDCESETRIIGASSVPLAQNGAQARLHEIADDAFEEEDLRRAARDRLSSS